MTEQSDDSAKSEENAENSANNDQAQAVDPGEVTAEAEIADEETAQAEELDPVAALEAEIESLNQQLSDARDQALRAAAEAQNVRRRAEKDVENAHKFGMEKFCAELLQVVDNLERAQDQADRDSEVVKPLLEGVELTHKSFIDVLSKFKLERLDPVGEPFDPQLHQAMTMIESPDSEPNTVLDVMQKGYTLHGRLLRPAMVVVSKGE